MAITCAKILSDFLSHQYPFWGACKLELQMQPSQNVLYLHCQTPGRRAAFLKDLNEIRYLDIGIQTFIVLCQDAPDIIIETAYPKIH